MSDSTAVAIGCEADSGTTLTIEDHRIVLACNYILIDRASAAAYTPHGLPYDILHKGIVLSIYLQFQPAFHPALDVASSDHAWTLAQNTHSKDQGTFGIPFPLTIARKFPCYH